MTSECDTDLVDEECPGFHSGALNVQPFFGQDFHGNLASQSLGLIPRSVVSILMNCPL